MRIAVITGEYPPTPGGIADYTARLVGALADLGHEVNLVATSHSLIADHPGVTIQGSAGWTPGLARANAERILDGDPSLVVLQYAPHLYGRGGVAPGIVALMGQVAKGGTAKRVAIMHELFSPWGRTPRQWARSAIHRVQLRNLVRLTDAIVATNPGHMVSLKRLAHALPVHLIPVGATVVPDTRTVRENRASDRGNRIILGDFSFASVSKRPRLLLEALRYLGDDGCLVCIGGLPSDRGEAVRFENSAAALSIADRVRIVPFETAGGVSRLLSGIDIYLHTSTTGASSRSTSLASALAHGLPVVAFRGIETPDFYEGAVELIPLGDDAAFCAAVHRLSHDRWERERLGKAGLDAFSANQLWPLISGRLLEVA